MFHGDHLSDPQTLHQIKYYFLNYGHKIHLLSLQSSCVSVFNPEDLRRISCDWASFTVSETHLKFLAQTGVLEVGILDLCLVCLSVRPCRYFIQ